MSTKPKKSRISTSSPWFLAAGQLVAIRPELLEVLRAMDGRSPRDIFAERRENGAEASEDVPYWQSAEPAEVESCEPKTAIVSLIGPVTQYRGVCDWMFGGTSLESFMADLEEAIADDDVSSVVMLVDSPGGEAAGIADAADRIRALAAIKPIVAYVVADGCSAAYWLASASSQIIASQTAFLGSIGVVMTYIDDSEANTMAGLRQIEFVSSVSPNKRPDPSTPDGRAQIQTSVDAFGEIFVNAVATFRGVTAEKVKKDFGQGGVLIGASAVTAGLADKVGTRDDAIQAAAQLAGATSDSTTGESPLLNRATGASTGTATMPKTAEQIKAEHPEAAAAIGAASAETERNRILGILKYNTAAHRAVAGAKIDAAIADGKTTAGDLAESILSAHDDRRKKVAADRLEDADETEVEEPVTPPDTQEVAAAKGTGKAKINPTAIYGRMNSQYGGGNK